MILVTVNLPPDDKSVDSVDCQSKRGEFNPQQIHFPLPGNQKVIKLLFFF